ncbi:unnamed protein product [Effrenium voratum]|nr:unnamed protein product [Effrenium voratum]CAJ1436286.1 unnamed protein product [Effrenium voratum]
MERMTPAKRSRPVVVAGLALAAFGTYLWPSFVPPPAPAEARGSPAAPWDLQSCLEDGLDGAMDAVTNMFDAADNLVGPSLNPQLLPAGGAPAPKDFKQAIIEPLTRLYMKYRTAVYPRCKDCRIIVRYGRLWRLCRVRRHKLRQPGITTFKKRMNKYGGWAQSNVAPGR